MLNWALYRCERYLLRAFKQERLQKWVHKTISYAAIPNLFAYFYWGSIFEHFLAQAEHGMMVVFIEDQKILDKNENQVILKKI